MADLTKDPTAGTDTVVVATTQVKVNAPRVRTVVAELLSVEEREGKKGTVMLLNLQPKEGKVIQVAAAPAFWIKAGRQYNPGSIVSVDYEERIGGETTYMKEDVVTQHDTSGNTLSTIVPYSTTAWMRSLKEDSAEAFMNRGIAIIVDATVENKSPLATFLGSFNK